MYGNFVVAKNYCSPTTNQLPHLFIVQFSASVELDVQEGHLTSNPKHSEQQWIAKKILQSILVWLVGDNFRGAESLALN